MEFPIRINKYLRDKDFASRREADKLVEAGLVFINRKRVDNGAMVNEGDKVMLKENKNNKKELQYLAYYKPKGLPTQDLPNFPSVISNWRKHKLYPVGRLDKESEGLLFLTNDGRFAREVLSDKKEWEKEYTVVVKEPFHSGITKILASGMDTQAFGKLLPMRARTFTKNKISIILNEGKKHQIRVLLAELNYTVVSLKRVRIGHIRLGDLKPGETRSIKV
jgi:23S rRNA pseudouridine2604 synthase